VSDRVHGLQTPLNIELKRMLDLARKDDVVIVWRLDRLVRSIRHF
jgi:DNA invertase Pin-like site-specific DNA recombinase